MRLRVRELAAERGLGVGPGGRGAQRRAAELLAVTEEGGDHIAPLALERLGRHREQSVVPERSVVGEQGHDRIDIAAPLARGGFRLEATTAI